MSEYLFIHIWTFCFRLNENIEIKTWCHNWRSKKRKKIEDKLCINKDVYTVQCTVHTPKSPRSNPITLIGYYSIALLIQISQINKLYKYHNVLNSERYGADECILVDVAGSVFSSLRYICTALKWQNNKYSHYFSELFFYQIKRHQQKTW